MFYDIFVKLCNEKNIKPTPLLKSLKVSPSISDNWKIGGEPNAKILKDLADYFNVSVDYLLGREEKEKPTSNDVSFNEFIQALEKLGIKDNLTAQKDLLHKICTLTLEQKNLIFQMIDNFKDKDE